MGLGRVELPTSRLSGVRSNQLSYRPFPAYHGMWDLSKLNSEMMQVIYLLLRKEVIQPQVPLRLPCYDFTPITNHTFGACLPCGLARRLLVQPAFVV